MHEQVADDRLSHRDRVLHAIPNGEVRKVSSHSRAYVNAVVDVYVPYEEDLARVRDLLASVTEEAFKAETGAFAAAEVKAAAIEDQDRQPSIHRGPAMENIENIIKMINKELAPQFEKKLWGYLEGKDKEWLIEQIVRLTLDAHSLESMDRRVDQKAKARRITERTARLKKMELDEAKLSEFIKQYEGYDRERLIADGYLLPNAP